MANKTEQMAFQIGDPIAQGLGMSIVDVEFKKENGKQYLRFFIDMEKGVGIDDCEAFSKAVEKELDGGDFIDIEYVLEVSSPGVDRQLRTEREFKHYLGRIVDVKLYMQLDGKKEFTARLDAYEDGNITLSIDGKAFTVNEKEMVFIKLHFEF